MQSETIKHRILREYIYLKVCYTTEPDLPYAIVLSILQIHFTAILLRYNTWPIPLLPIEHRMRS